MKISDVELHLHEHLKNLDEAWIKKVLVSLIGENRQEFDTVQDWPLLHGKDTSGAALLMTEIFAPMLQVLSMTLTKNPKHLVVADNVSLEDAPFRITFLGFCLDCWESSAIERLDLLTPGIRHSPLRGHDWMLTLQGCQPMPKPRGEEKILPRLKLSTKPPNFDFSKLRQNLIDNSDDESRIALLRGLHEKLWHELYAGMERFLQRLGVPDRCFKLIEIVIATCSHCNAFKPIPRRPRFGVELSGRFGDCLMIDLLYIWHAVPADD